MFPMLKVEFNLLKLFLAFIPILLAYGIIRGIASTGRFYQKWAIIQFLLYSFAG